jgi:hypothetical protein
LEEVIKSPTAIKLGIDNTPNEEHLNNLKDWAKNIFQPIRNHFKVPIFISSGYRSPELNEKIGGVKNSQHCLGQACDIDQDNKNSIVTNKEIFDFIEDNLEFDQLIYEFGTDSNPDWVHVSYKEGSNRNEILKTIKSSGITQFILYD